MNFLFGYSCFFFIAIIVVIFASIFIDFLKKELLINLLESFFNCGKGQVKIKFVVKLLGATVFQVEGYSEEKYFKDQLVSYNSKTLQNDKKKFVNLTFDQENRKFYIKGSSYNGEASADNVIGNWWNHKILQASSQISPISGSIKDQVVTFLGKEKIDLYGKVYDVDHFTLKSKDMSIPKDKRLDFNIWYDRKNLMILKVSYSRMGNWEYKLKNFN